MEDCRNSERAGVAVYNLNGVNPVKNPGTYKFKNDLAGKHGRDVFYVGRFDAHAGWITQACVESSDALRTAWRQLRQLIRSGHRRIRSLQFGNLKHV